ncbi:hypothetical protein CERSUDRAFT_123212 [Gelatoporia subvermispora B]|uniref:DUF974-domain-containing protein n=1 Tax=Ceriporiopsis subvermispora (strain B) TaxID=914234 RepID=M2QNN2_CERS8|nr:hypothetical protein CERSUDRAFT_123212 [Gelatoporia subvermispora B]
MDGAGHLLSLKVMRVSRPSLASTWEPYYSSSQPFSQRSTASITSLQGKAPLPGHPNTLRDLAHASEMLMLPSSFGTIQIGEVFTSCLSVNNETNAEIDGVHVRVEMQTATSKTVLLEMGGPNSQLAVGASLEKVVSHEIKELGQHVLGCTVSYRLPPGYRPVPGTSSEAVDPGVQTFRKFYKFAVTNPLSVKTKVHVPRAPSALLSRNEREKVFLEVHIQNLTQDGMWLERVRFECSDGWQAQDANRLGLGDADGGESIFTGSMALLQPQDMRQYIYILSPTVPPPFPITHQPGSILPLGRLDISWRSPFGEPGRLLTSMLSRRIPLIQAPPPTQAQAQPPPVPSKQPPSAIPSHLQRSATVTAAVSSRPQSPQLGQRPMSPPVHSNSPPPYRPDSPFRARQATAGSVATQPQSPVPTSPNPAARRADDPEVDLVVRHIPKESLRVESPFKVTFTLTVSAAVPNARGNEARRQRVLSLVIQHVQPARLDNPATAQSPPAATSRELWSPRLTSGFSTPSPYDTPYRGDFHDTLAQRLLHASPRQLREDDTDTDGGGETPAPPSARIGLGSVKLPPPNVQAGASGTAKSAQSRDVVFLGTSTLLLPQFRLHAPATAGVTPGKAAGHGRTASEFSSESETDSDAEAAEAIATRVLASQDFELTYMPLKSGMLTVGGLRALLVEDRLEIDVEHLGQATEEGVQRFNSEAQVLREWDVVAEIWIKA